MSVYVRLGCAAALVAAAVPAWAGAARASSGPQLAIRPASGLLDGQQVSVTGTGFPAGIAVYLSECSDVPGQPTVDFAGAQVPVSCSNPLLSVPGTASLATVGADGAFSVPFTVMTGITGPASLGLDSAGRSSVTDAAAYPCPPTAAQLAAGAFCRVYAGQAPFNVPIGPSGQPGPTAEASATIGFGTPRPFRPVAAADPPGGLSSGETVQVTGSGFTPDSPGVVVECNRTPGEPWGGGAAAFLPVGCAPLPQSSVVFTPGPVVSGSGSPVSTTPPPLPGSTTFLTDGSGALSAELTIREGNLGSSAASGAYPCPPTGAQLAAGGACELAVRDAANDLVWVPLVITGPVPVPSMTVTPATDLYRGQSVEVSGSNFTPLSEGGVVECSDAPGQPTVPYAGFDIPVSCTDPNLALTGVSADGTLQTVFTVVSGVTGPPVPGPDSAGRPAADDASAYPCPPTAAQQAAGDSCYLSVGDLAGDAARTAIGFAAQPQGFRLAAPIVAMAATPDGRGYWLIGADGGVFSFGDAGFYGSAARTRLAAPIVAMAATPDGRGYLLATAAGAVMAFGDALSAVKGPPPPSSRPLASAAAVVASAGGYWICNATGQVATGGSARLLGALPPA